MRKLALALLLCVLAVAQADAQEEKNKENGNDNGDTLVVTARLIEVPGTFPPNDLYNYVYIMKYRVLRVERGNYDEKTILVGHYNPLIPRDQINDKMDALVDGDVKKFEKGDKHVLSLIKPMDEVWEDAIEDEYFDVQDDKFFAVRADNIQ